MGSTHDLHVNTRILLHFTQFQIRRQKLYQPYGPWEHFPYLSWRDKEAVSLEPDSDDTYLGQLCAHKETSQCTHSFLCNDCMANHSCNVPDDESYGKGSQMYHHCSYSESKSKFLINTANL